MPDPDRSNWNRLGCLLALCVVLVLILPVLLPYLGFDTQYAPGYSEAGFNGIQLDDAESEVLRRLGPPLSTQANTPTTQWLYCAPEHPGYREDGGLQGTFTSFTFDAAGLLSRVHGVKQVANGDGVQLLMGDGQNYLELTDGEAAKLSGSDKATVRERFGAPRHTRDDRAVKVLVYSRSPNSTHYRLRRIHIDAEGKVTKKVAYFYWD